MLKNKAPFLLHGAIVVLMLIFFLGTKDMPLISTLGFESANIFVLLFAPLFCLASVLHSIKKNARNFSRIFFYELLWALCTLGLYSSLLAYNGFAYQSCSPGFGFIAYLLTLSPPLLLNIALGSLLAALVSHMGVRLLIFFVAYPAYFLLIAWCWWQEANFRLLTHGSLILNSDLLTGADLDRGMTGFRIATTLIALAIITIGIKLVNFSRPHFSRTRSKTPFIIFFLIAFLCALAFVTHWQSLKSIGKNRSALEHDYSLIISDDNLIVRANPILVSEAQAKDILFEAKLYQSRLERDLGKLEKTPVTIWLHSDNEQKFSYTGAKNVHFALPKRREIHISESTVPHPILGHELAHIYIGEYATTLLGVPGSFGILPNMALTEGLAMLLSSELAIENGLTMLEQAQAFYQAGLRVDILKLFAINPTQFALYNPHTSYIFAGAFLEFILWKSPNRPELLQNLITSGTIDSLFGDDKKRDASIDLFYQRLNNKVPAYAVAWAKKHFLMKSILGNNCQKMYQQEKESFSRNVLNNNIASALASIATLSKDTQISIISEAKDEALQESNYLKAHLFSDALFTLLPPDDPRYNEFRLDYAQIMMAEHRYEESKAILAGIDANYLSLPAQRALGILNVILEHDPEQSQAIHEFIFAKTKNELSRAAKLGINVGQQNTSSPLYYISSYLYARLLISDKDYASASKIIAQLLESGTLLPQFLLHETERMRAENEYNLKNYLYAKELYKALIEKSADSAEQKIANHYIWHIEAILKGS